MRLCLDCHRLIRTGSRCAACHARHEQTRRPSATIRYGRAWPALSQSILERDAFVCRLRLPGCTVHATTVDHIIPKRAGGTDDPTNLRAACRSCNSAKGGRVTPR